MPFCASLPRLRSRSATSTATTSSCAGWTETLGRRFEAPPGSVYEADIIDGASRIHRRWFYDDALRLFASRELPLSDYDPRERPWYQEALYSRERRGPPRTFSSSWARSGMTVSRTSVDRRLCRGYGCHAGFVVKEARRTPHQPICGNRGFRLGRRPGMEWGRRWPRRGTKARCVAGKLRSWGTRRLQRPWKARRPRAGSSSRLAGLQRCSVGADHRGS
jgi:hypothetical protein